MNVDGLLTLKNIQCQPRFELRSRYFWMFYFGGPQEPDIFLGIQETLLRNSGIRRRGLFWGDRRLILIVDTENLVTLVSSFINYTTAHICC